MLEEVPLPAVGLLFVKRLAVLVLRPALDFLLGDALEYLSLVEERQALEVVLARGADQRFYCRFLCHRATATIDANINYKEMENEISD